MTKKKSVNSDIPMMVAENMGASLKQYIMQELKNLPDTWNKLNQTKQNELVQQIEAKVKYMVATASNTMAGGHMVSVKGTIDSMALKDKIKLTATISSSNSEEALFDLYRSAGEECRIVLCDSEKYLGGMEYVEVPDPDQIDMIDPDDALLWCVVVPMRSGQSVVPAPSHEQAEGFARKTRKLLMNHDADVAGLVYAKPFDENKASHARMLKKKCWKQLEEWYAKLESGELSGDDIKMIGFDGSGEE